MNGEKHFKNLSHFEKRLRKHQVSFGFQVFLCCQSSFLPCSHIIFSDERTGSIYLAQPSWNPSDTDPSICSVRAPALLLYLFWERSFHPSNLACLGQNPTREQRLYSDGLGQFCTAHLHRCHFSSVNCRHCSDGFVLTVRKNDSLTKGGDKLHPVPISKSHPAAVWGAWKADPLWNDPFWCGEVIGKMSFSTLRQQLRPGNAFNEASQGTLPS